MLYEPVRLADTIGMQMVFQQLRHPTSPSGSQVYVYINGKNTSAWISAQIVLKETVLDHDPVPAQFLARTWVQYLPQSYKLISQRNNLPFGGVQFLQFDLGSCCGFLFPARIELSERSLTELAGRTYFPPSCLQRTSYLSTEQKYKGVQVTVACDPPIFFILGLGPLEGFNTVYLVGSFLLPALNCSV